MTQARLLAALRHIAGVVVGGAIGAIVWLVVMQEGPERDWSEHDFNQIMGQAFVGREDDVRVAGFVATLLVAIAIAAVYALVVEPLLGKRAAWRAPIAFAPVPLLLWGLVLSPGVTAFKDTAIDVKPERIPGGVFGFDSGETALVLAIVASVLFALAVSRIYRLMVIPSWWRSRGDDAAAGHGVLGDLLIRPIDPSLELAEKRREEGGEGPGR